MIHWLIVVAVICAGTLGAVAVITKMKATRDALAENQERLSLTLRTSKIGVWSWDIAANVVTADENGSMIFGLGPGQFPRTVEGFAAMIHADDRQNVQAAITAAIEQRAEYDTEFRTVWPGGAIRVVIARGRAYQDKGGRVTRMTGVCWDVTARRQAEDELRSANEKLAASVAALQRRKEETAVLAELADLLQACTSSADAYAVVARFAEHLFPSYAGALCIYSASRNLVNRVATWGSADLIPASFDPTECWALRRGHPHVVDPHTFATPCRHVLEGRGVGHACFPLMAQGVGLGILYLHFDNGDSSAANPQFPLEDVQLAITVAERVGLSLSNLALQEALRVQTIRDPLTGLFNRRYLEESGERELQRSARRAQPVSVLMIDVDHFKRFNDTNGHEAGDALLRGFGRFLREQLGPDDVACRYGGEEFCVLLGDSTIDASLRRAETLRSSVKHLNVQYGGKPLGAITLSIGLASYPSDADDLPALIGLADHALYRAKAEGRDRVTTASSVAVTAAKSL